MSDDRIEKSEAEWRATLTPSRPGDAREGHRARVQRRAHRQQGSGVYKCAACGEALFDAATKYDWQRLAELFQPIEPVGWRRRRIARTACGARRFTAAAVRASGPCLRRRPKPTGQRYCINSVSLDFEQRG